MASAAAGGISTTLLMSSSPRAVQHLHPSSSPAASPLPACAAFPSRPRPRSLTTTTTTTRAAVQTTQDGAAVQAQQKSGGIQRWTTAPVSAIAPATEDKSIFLITIDVSRAPALVEAFTTPGQYLMTRVPAGEKRPPAYMCISSAPRSGLHFDLLVRSVPGTTSEQLCNLKVGDIVELGPVMGRGFAIQHINPPVAAETMFLFAVGEGISPVRSLIEFGFAASERANVRLYYATKDRKSMPYQDRFEKWEKTGVKVVPLTETIPETYLESNLGQIIGNPLSTGAVIVAPRLLQEVITGVLLDFGVPHEKILSIEWSPADPFA